MAQSPPRKVRKLKCGKSHRCLVCAVERKLVEGVCICEAQRFAQRESAWRNETRDLLRLIDMPTQDVEPLDFRYDPPDLPEIARSLPSEPYEIP